MSKTYLNEYDTKCIVFIEPVLYIWDKLAESCIGELGTTFDELSLAYIQRSKQVDMGVL